MKDLVHISSVEAAHLARALARQTGRTISEVVLEVLRQYRPGRRQVAPLSAPSAGGGFCARIARAMAEPEIPIEALYDEATGLPA